MTQHELVDIVHSYVTKKVPLSEITRMITGELVKSGITDLPGLLAKLEPAAICYVRTYPDDLEDGPWDI